MNGQATTQPPTRSRNAAVRALTAVARSAARAQ